MRVGVFLELGSPTAGGGYRFQDDVFAAFVAAAQASQHEFVVVCDAEMAAALAGGMPPNVTIRTLTAPRVPCGELLQRVPLLRRYVARRVEVQPVPEGVDFMWFVGAPGRVAEVPYATVVWDLQHRSHSWFPEVSARGQWDHRERLYQAVLQRASIVIVGTEVGKSEVILFYGVPAERIIVLPHPTPAFALNAVPAEIDLEKKYGLLRPFIFYPAQFWAHKNHVNLLHAVARLRERSDLNLQLALVGSDQGNRAHVEERIRALGLAHQVKMLGFVPQADLVHLYRSCLALTYVSFCGPENLPPLEAFALGCPVIAADIPGAREQLGEAALFVRPEDPEHIAQAIERLAGDADLRQRLIQAGLGRARRFTADDFVRGVLAALDRFEVVRRSWAPG
jgi:glycosyltransferase involved in cell wall biosynthesis